MGASTSWKPLTRCRKTPGLLTFRTAQTRGKPPDKYLLLAEDGKRREGVDGLGGKGGKSGGGNTHSH